MSKQMEIAINFNYIKAQAQKGMTIRELSQLNNQAQLNLKEVKQNESNIK